MTELPGHSAEGESEEEPRFRDSSPDDTAWWVNLLATLVGATVLLVAANVTFDGPASGLDPRLQTALFYGLWLGPAPLLLRRYRHTWPRWRLALWSVAIVPWWTTLAIIGAIVLLISGI